MVGEEFGGGGEVKGQYLVIVAPRVIWNCQMSREIINVKLKQKKKNLQKQQKHLPPRIFLPTYFKLLR